MSYHISIVRTKQGKTIPIKREDVETLNAKLQTLQLTQYQERVEITDATKSSDWLLIWQNGEIWTKNPEPETLQLMLELAERLNARVRGDELETYRTANETYTHPDDAVSVELGQRETKHLIRKQKIKNFFVHFVIFGTFAAIGILVHFCFRN